MSPDAEIWTIIVAMAIGTFVIRFAFLGIVGDRAMPAWVLRHLRYTGVAILPALVTPFVVWPDATGGTFDPPRIAAALVTLAVGYFTKSLLGAIGAGICTLYTLLYLF